MKKINISGPLCPLRENEDMKAHTTFKTGGPAELFAEPATSGEVETLLREARAAGLPVLVTGEGANLLVSDRGVSGLVISTRRLASLFLEKPRERPPVNPRAGQQETVILRAGAGASISRAAAFAADSGLGGLEFLYSMPGSAGGAVWMNARCYGFSVSDVLESVIFLDAGLALRYADMKEPLFRGGFGYKRSPFQAESSFILEAAFCLRPSLPHEAWKKMRAIEEDRRAKGHFAAPSAGSVFKNNRAFGAPTGEILDGLGFRGRAEGGARVSPLHANIIINEKNASSSDIRRLIEILQTAAAEKTGFRLEPEIIYAGDWTGWGAS